MEYISDKPRLEDENGHMNPLIQDFLRVFEKFAAAEEMFPISIKVQNFLKNHFMGMFVMPEFCAQSMSALCYD